MKNFLLKLGGKKRKRKTIEVFVYCSTRPPHSHHELFMFACINTEHSHPAEPHRLVARRPAALPAQVEPPPDWTVPAILRALTASPKLQGAGGRKCSQILEVRGQAVLTCGEGEGAECFHFRLVHRAAADTAL